MSTLRLAPGVPGLEALGATAPEDWLGDGSALATGDRLELLSRAAGQTVARVPLPGTPDARGVQREAPRGAGTGMLILRVWRGGGAELLRARFTRPRSASLAARRWNLICHLRAHGVGTPALVAMGEGGPGESFLLERELDGFEPLSRVAALALDARRRRLILRSLGLALGALFRAGAWLPELGPDGILIERDPLTGGYQGPDACAALELRGLQAEHSALRALRVKRTRLPGVALVDLRRARLLGRVGPRRRARLLASIGRELEGRFTPLEGARVAALARRG